MSSPSRSGGAQSVDSRASLTNVRTVATAQPSLANTNLSDHDGPVDANNNMATGEAPATPRVPMSPGVRFTVALLMLGTQGFVLLVAQGLIGSRSGFNKHAGQFVVAFVSFFASEWIRIHSFALTRHRRAFFDEANILETYQPRARTHGHLFQPDPPTPGPVVKIAEDPNAPQRSASEQAAFNANRDAHYANMFEYAMRVAKEAEEADKQALAAQKERLARESATSASSTSTAVPKGEPLLDEGAVSDKSKSKGASSIGTPLELPASLQENSDGERSSRRSVHSPASATPSSSGTSTSAASASTSGKKRRKRQV